ncbi:MAG: glutaredoxin 3 [Pseudomonadota bacterium]
MSKVEVYTTPMCPYCWRAKRLLDGKKVAYTEINLWSERDRRQEMVERAGGRTSVPQIFIDDQSIGGSDELAALEQSGELDRLLTSAAP